MILYHPIPFFHPKYWKQQVFQKMRLIFWGMDEKQTNQYHYEKHEQGKQKGKIVLSDRFNDSTIAYQYYGSAKFKDTKILDTLYEMVAPNFKPDLTFLLDIDVKIGLARSFAKAEGMENKELRFENTEIAFHERLRQGYLSLAKKEEKRFRVIEAAADIESVTKKIIETYQEFRATSCPPANL